MTIKRMVVVHKLGERFYLSIDGGPMKSVTANAIRKALGL
jgi:hypothetical protein